MGQIFISYSRTDSSFVDQLADALKHSGYALWMDRTRIQGGESWRGQITQAIRECDAFLLVISPPSMTSDNVQNEVNLAGTHKRRIIPLFYQSCDIPPEIEYVISGKQYVDFTQGYTQALDELVTALGSQTSTRASTSSNSGGQTLRAPAAPPVLGLAEILPGSWQIQIGIPYMAIAFQMMLEISPNGFFRGQVANPEGMFDMTGQCQITSPNQVVLQGQQTNGFMVMPYMTMIQFTQISTNQLAGLTSGSEQVVWNRTG